MRPTIKIEGLKELDAALAELPKATAKNVLRRVGRKALEPMVAAARDGAPVKSGALRKSMKVASRLSKRQASLHRKMFKSDKASVELFAGASNLPHAHLLEFGTVNIAPRPFMRPAWDGNHRGMLESIKTDLAIEIEKAAKRLARKAARLGK